MRLVGLMPAGIVEVPPMNCKSIQRVNGGLLATSATRAGAPTIQRMITRTRHYRLDDRQRRSVNTVAWLTR